MNELPAVSHLQYLALVALQHGDCAGREVRAHLERFGVRHSAAAFYQFMARLERDGYVDGWYEQVDAQGATVTERRYRITRPGRRAMTRTHEFYTALGRQLGEGTSHA